MATFLEQGIAAAKRGQKEEARALFDQVLQADDRNERAWLWMSEVAGTTAEQIACVERALAINPSSSTAQLALKRLKETKVGQIAPAPVVIKTPAPSDAPASGLLKSAPRKPYRLNADPVSASAQSINHHPTVAMPSAGSGASFNGLRTSAGGASPAFSNSAPTLESIPLLPALIFGALLVTAMGGLGMLGLMLLFS